MDRTFLEHFGMDFLFSNCFGLCPFATGCLQTDLSHLKMNIAKQNRIKETKQIHQML